MVKSQVTTVGIEVLILISGILYFFDTWVNGTLGVLFWQSVWIYQHLCYKDYYLRSECARVSLTWPAGWIYLWGRDFFLRGPILLLRIYRDGDGSKKFVKSADFVRFLLGF